MTLRRDGLDPSKISGVDDGLYSVESLGLGTGPYRGRSARKCVSDQAICSEGHRGDPRDLLISGPRVDPGSADLALRWL